MKWLRDFIASVKNTYYITQKELISFFVSPVAYTVLAAYAIIAGIYFYLLVSNFYTRITQYQVYAQIYRNPEILQRVNLNEMVIAPFFQFLIIFMIFVVPAISMRTLAEEKRAKTDELLFTSPIGTYSIVLGKFLSAFLFLVLMLATSGIYIGVLFHYGDPELGPVLSGYLGLILGGSILLAMGIFGSSLTSNQITAYFVAVGLSLILLITGWAGQLASGKLASVLNYLSITQHYQDLGKGIISTIDLVFYATLITSFLFLSKQSIETAKWR